VESSCSSFHVHQVPSTVSKLFASGAGDLVPTRVGIKKPLETKAATAGRIHLATLGTCALRTHGAKQSLFRLAVQSGTPLHTTI
jgi:hypothetical protein